MRYIFISFAFLFACNQPNKLEEKEQTLHLSYIAWACACPNWASQEALEKFGGDTDEQDRLAAHCIYLEAADTVTRLPDFAWGVDDVISFTGQSYEKEGVPADMQSEQRPAKAKIFRYTKFEIVRSDVSAGPDSDTFVVSTKAALIYLPDSLQEENRKKLVGEENYRIGKGDDAYGIHEAGEYLESVKLPILTADGKKFLKFVHGNGTAAIIKTDTLKSIWGMYFFDPGRDPQEIDYFSIEKEFEKYFHIH